ncbi:hypothetical protein SRABI128_04075 [Microbacterium sp. Bi128]|nr:hypothetical protein SRABI128_04075 [Microbacterium sp. Bi128]
MQLQEVSHLAGSNRLASGGPVREGDQQSAGIHHGTDDAIVQDVAAAVLSDLYRLPGPDRFSSRQGRHAQALVRGGVEQEFPAAGAEGRRRGVRDDRFQSPFDGGVVPFGVLVDPGDGTSRQDVVKLLQQDQPPEALELRSRVAVPGPHSRGGTPELGFPEEVLAAPVPQLGPGLAGVGAAVQFQVHLPHPDRKGLILGLGLAEEAGRRADPHLRGSFQIRRALRCGQHLAGWAPAAVAVPERNQRRASASVVPVVPFCVRQVPGTEVGVVAVHRWEMGEDAGAVDSLPVEGVVRHPVDLVPGDLLGQEPAAACGLDDLRQGGGIPEGVRQPRLLAINPEFGQEKAFTLEELPCHGLAAGHVGVGFDPHPADGNELAGADLVPDAPEELRIVLLHPRELLGGGARKDEIGILVHQGHDVGERPGALADGFPDRPQPGRIDVGVARGHKLVR